MFRRLLCSLIIVVSGLPSLAVAQDDERDPTVPKPSLLKRLAPDRLPETSITDVPQVPLTAPSPAVAKTWKLKLKSLVTSPDKSGRATVEIGDQRFSIELPAVAYRAPVLVMTEPLTEESVVGESSAGTSSAAEKTSVAPHFSLEAPPDKMASNFAITPAVIQVDGVWLQLVSHFDDVLVFRIMETGKLLIAR